MSFYKGFKGYIAYKNATKYCNVNKEKNKQRDDKSFFSGHSDEIGAFQHFALHEYGIHLSNEEAGKCINTSHLPDDPKYYKDFPEKECSTQLLNENVYGKQTSQQKEETKLLFANMKNDFYKRKDDIYKFTDRDQQRWRTNKNKSKQRTRDRDNKRDNHF